MLLCVFQGIFSVPVSVNFRRDFRGLDLASATPEYIGVGDWDSGLVKMAIDSSLMSEDRVFHGTMNHSHDVHIPEFRTTLPPVGKGHAVVTSNLPSSLNFASRGNCPVEKAVEARHAFACYRGFNVIEVG